MEESSGQIITAEISHYPLNRYYEPAILDFIAALKSFVELEVYSNAMSTQIKGNSNVVFKALQKAIELHPGQASSTVIKIVNRALPIESGHLEF